LRIEESLAEVSGHFIFGRTKSHTARAVPLSPGMVTVIERHLESIDTDPDTLLFMGPRARGPLAIATTTPSNGGRRLSASGCRR
jgi:hypothetical protein